MTKRVYSNIREIIGELIGKRLIDITQHDKDEWEATREWYVMLMFEDGSYLQFPIGDAGFHHYLGPDDEEETPAD